MKLKILTLLFLTSLFACKKDEPSTNTTASMTAKVNDVIFTAENNLDLNITKSGTGYYLYGASKNEEEAIWVYFPKLEKGDYLLNDVTNGKYGIYQNKNSKQYYTHPNGNNKLIITDITNDIVSGTFNFNPHGLTTQDTVIISDGVFKNIKVY